MQSDRLGDTDAVAAARKALDEKVDMILERLGSIEKPKSAKEFFTNVQYKKVGGELLTASCMFCKTSVTSTGLTRLKDHLAACVLCPARVKQPFKDLRAQVHAKRKLKEEQQALHQEEAADHLRKAKEAKLALVQQGIRGSFKSAEALVADEAIAQWFYANGIPFHAADSAADSLYKDMVRAIKAAPVGYVPPNRWSLAGPLIDTVHSEIQREIAQDDPEGKMKEKFGVTYTHKMAGTL